MSEPFVSVAIWVPFRTGSRSFRRKVHFNFQHALFMTLLSLDICEAIQKTCFFCSTFNSHARRGSFFRWICHSILDGFLWNHAVPVVLLVSLCIFLCFVTISSRHFAVANGFPSTYHCHSVWHSFSRCFFVSCSTIVCSMKFHIDFRLDQKVIENGIENGIEDHSKLESPSLLGHD